MHGLRQTGKDHCCGNISLYSLIFLAVGLALGVGLAQFLPKEVVGSKSEPSNFTIVEFKPAKVIVGEVSYEEDLENSSLGMNIIILESEEGRFYSYTGEIRNVLENLISQHCSGALESLVSDATLLDADNLETAQKQVTDQIADAIKQAKEGQQNSVSPSIHKF
jgi:hypothetical protein